MYTAPCLDAWSFGHSKQIEVETKAAFRRKIAELIQFPLDISKATAQFSSIPWKNLAPSSMGLDSLLPRKLPTKVSRV